MKKISAHTTLFELAGFSTDSKKYLPCLLGQVTASRTKIDAQLTDAAATMLHEPLTTPLRFELYLTRAFEEAFRIGQKPVDADTIAAILTPDLDELKARLTHNGHNANVLTEVLGTEPRETGHLSMRTTRVRTHARIARQPPGCWRALVGALTQYGSWPM
ncbi:hypothetical protein [Burkholderia lata]|nr:hypothetical protein [Burkholderia lata]